ncbi:lactonase family protein [Lewinella sp. IMCC34191]|uniref:lactonase family protein n=1 Tax=Lewinella sp. IMCC34191 TaxID=2259172 RepID=UPI000E232829|nr:beta-propeller fold lactonase family protein [Lewinella sp. IMCC34191]
MLLLVGAYTIDMGEDAPGRARGISAYDFSPKMGLLEYCGFTEEVNPSYLVVDDNNHVVYSVRECPEEDGAAVAAYRMKRGARRSVVFDFLGDVSLHGDHPCHLTKVDQTLVVSCYSSGSVHVIELEEDGKLGKYLQRVDLNDGDKQAHAHCAAYDKPRNRLYVCDLGSDKLRTYDRHPDGSLAEMTDYALSFSADSGPRHCVLHPGGDHLLVNCEFRGRVAVFDLRGDGPKEVTNVPALPQRAVDGASGAAIRVDRRGKNVYISERNYSVISTLRLDVEDDSVKLFTRDTYPSGGVRPRDISLSPDGNWLLSANLKDHSIGVFRIGAGGALQLQRVIRKIKSPTCLAWMSGI